MDMKEAERVALDRFKAAVVPRLAPLYPVGRITEQRHDAFEKPFMAVMLNPELHDGVEYILDLGQKQRRLFVIYCMNAGIDGLETMADDPKYAATRDGVLKSLRMSNADDVRRERIRAEVQLAHSQFWCFFDEDALNDATKEIFCRVAEEQRALLRLYPLPKKMAATPMEIDKFTPPSIRQAYLRQLERNGLASKERASQT